MCEILIEYGADPNALDGPGKSPLAIIDYWTSLGFKKPAHSVALRKAIKQAGGKMVGSLGGLKDWKPRATKQK